MPRPLLTGPSCLVCRVCVPCVCVCMKGGEVRTHKYTNIHTLTHTPTSGFANCVDFVDDDDVQFTESSVLLPGLLSRLKMSPL